MFTAIESLFRSPYYKEDPILSIKSNLLALPFYILPGEMVLLFIQLFRNPDVDHVFTLPDARKKLSGILPLI